MKIVRITAFWCPACLIMKPMVDQILEHYKTVEVIDYDYDLDEEDIKSLDIGNILPVMIVLKENEEVTRIIGEKSKKQMIDILEDVLERV